MKTILFIRLCHNINTVSTMSENGKIQRHEVRKYLHQILTNTTKLSMKRLHGENLDQNKTETNQLKLYEIEVRVERGVLAKWSRKMAT